MRREMGRKRKAETSGRWQPRVELTMAATQGASQQLGGARWSGTDMVSPPPPPVERNLLSLFKGDAKPRSKSARPAPSLALSLRVGSEEREALNPPASATIRGHDGSPHPLLGRRCSGPGRVPQLPVQAAAAAAPAPSSRPLSHPWLAMSIGPAQQSPVPLPASPGSAPLGSSSAGAGAGPQLGAWATRHRDTCSFYEALLEVTVLRRQLWSSREALEREQRKVWQLQLQLAAAGGSLACPACWVRPATVVLALHDEHLCLCRYCSAASRGNPSIACPRCAVARAAAAAEAAAPR